MAPRTRVRGCRCRSSSSDGTATPGRRLTRATPPLRDDVAMKMLIGIFLSKTTINRKLAWQQPAPLFPRRDEQGQQQNVLPEHQKQNSD